MANPLTKKAGGQPVWAWGAELVGAFLVFRWYRARQAAAAANAASGITSGPPAVGGSGLSSGSSVTPPANLQAWVQDLLSSGSTGNPGQLYNDIQAFLSGGCVSQSGYNAISNGIMTLGIPPGYIGSLPALSVCASNPVSGTSGGGTSGGGSTITAPPAGTSPPAGTPVNPAAAPGSGAVYTGAVDPGNGVPIVQQPFTPVPGLGGVVVDQQGRYYNNWTRQFLGTDLAAIRQQYPNGV